MKRFTKSVLVVALGLATSAVLAGEIDNSTVDGRGATNTSIGDQSRALQRIGVAAVGGKIKDSDIHAIGVENHANGANARAQQDIGVAQDGRLGNVSVFAGGAFNRALGDDSLAVQEIGKAKGTASFMKDSTVLGNNAFNQANARATAEQKIGVAE